MDEITVSIGAQRQLTPVEFKKPPVHHSSGPGVTNVIKPSMHMQLFAQYGPLIGGDDLRKVLAYPSREAFRLAVMRGNCPVPVFAIANRRGKFAFVEDVAVWLESHRDASASSGTHQSHRPQAGQL